MCCCRYRYIIAFVLSDGISGFSEFWIHISFCFNKKISVIRYLIISVIYGIINWRIIAEIGISKYPKWDVKIGTSLKVRWPLAGAIPRTRHAIPLKNCSNSRKFSPHIVYLIYLYLLRVNQATQFFVSPTHSWTNKKLLLGLHRTIWRIAKFSLDERIYHLRVEDSRN